MNRKIRLYLLSVVALGLAAWVVLDLTGWQRLEAVTLDGKVLEDWPSKLALDSTGRTLEQPLSVIAEKLLEDRRTARVEISYDLPNQLEIETNRFEPICFVLDRSSSRLAGIERSGRVVPLKKDCLDWERPVIVGVEADRMFEPCDDPRVALLISRLAQLAEDNTALYRLIDEVDLSADDYGVVTLAGLGFRLKVTAERFYGEMTEFIDFVQKYHPDLTGTRLLDMRFANLVIQRAKRN